ncbi:MAG: di-heme oxidoredictase family protein [Jannaschia sp.]
MRFILTIAMMCAAVATPIRAEPIAVSMEPHLAVTPRTSAEAARVAAVTSPTTEFDAPERFEANQGGAGTVRRRSDRQAFSLPQANLDFAQQGDFLLGNGLFEKLWVGAPASTIASDGLGPMFNTRSCQSCHLKDGRGHAPMDADDDAASLVVRLGRPIGAAEVDELTAYLGALPDPVLGHQLSDRSLPGQPAEGRVRVAWEPARIVELPGGNSVTLHRPIWSLPGAALHPDTRISPRVAPQMIGLGLVEAIPAADILAHADPEDADGDGVSGRPNVVWSPEYETEMLGRFGVRATTPTLRQQAADAFNADMGLSSPLRPDPAGDCTTEQTACRSGPHGTDDHGTEVAGESLDLVAFYSGTLGVPARVSVDDPQVLRGKELFHAARCTACHVPKFVTHRLEDRPEHSFQLIWPYSDFLLHDMGPGLADALPAGRATGSEWRTPPLWGLGLVEQVGGHRQYLHDGRARSLAEAILWHDGEGRAARDAYAILSAVDRAVLHAFLESL